jgi:hypothetical protein
VNAHAHDARPIPVRPAYLTGITEESQVIMEECFDEQQAAGRKWSELAERGIDGSAVRLAQPEDESDDEAEEEDADEEDTDEEDTDEEVDDDEDEDEDDEDDDEEDEDEDADDEKDADARAVGAAHPSDTMASGKYE